MKPTRKKGAAAALSLPFREGMISEKLLQFIWQFQYFNGSSLQTTGGEPLQVVHPGNLNGDAGPDFLNAQVRIGDTLFAGSVEIHLQTSLWTAHGHDGDPNYSNVVLHVVLEDDEPTHKPHLPVLELQSRIPGVLLERYGELLNNAGFIPCGARISTVPSLVWTGWKDRLVAERLQRKSREILKQVEGKTYRWEEGTWWMLARQFGARVNRDAFEALARTLPVKLLSRHKPQIHQLEALLFGQAGLLQKPFNEAYPRMLQREYSFLKKKYALQSISVPLQFLRMRPGNFPTVRLAQLAMLLHYEADLFPLLLETESLAVLRKLFEVTANDYWHYHYRFDEPSAFRKKKLGKDMIDSLVINVLVPMLFTYGLHHGKVEWKERALGWLEEVAAESNAVIRGFGSLGIDQGQTAFDSQALLELKGQYCDGRLCVSCAVGNHLLRGGENNTGSPLYYLTGSR